MVEVEILESGMVVPLEETPKRRLWLSDLDLLNPGHTPTIYYYRSNGDANFFSPSVLKAALSKALVPFYPLAGRLVVGNEGRLEIDCNGDGALFVVARSESTLDDLGEAVPSDETKRLLVPSVAAGESPCVLLMYQVTFFKCGGVCFGTAQHHTAVDGSSGIHFLNTWSDIARGLGVAVPPILERTVLRTRSLPAILHKGVVNGIKLHLMPPTGSTPFETAILKLSKAQVDSLKDGREGTRSLSTFKAVAAYVWRCACKARKLDLDQETRLYMPVDLRRRFVPPLPQGYVGNAFLRVSTVATVGEILSNSLGFGAQKIQDMLAALHPSLQPDAVEPPKDAESLMEEGSWEMQPSDVWVNSWLAMPVYDLDFGWGKSVFVVRAAVQLNSFVYLMRSPGDNGSITLVVGLEPETLPRFTEFLYQDLASAEAQRSC